MTDFSNVKELTASRYNMSVPTTLTPTGVTQTINWQTGDYQVLNLGSAGGDVALTLSNPVGGTIYTLKIIQHATVAKAVTWPATVKWALGSAPIISTGASAVDVITLLYDGTNYLSYYAQDIK